MDAVVVAGLLMQSTVVAQNFPELSSLEPFPDDLMMEGGFQFGLTPEQRVILEDLVSEDTGLWLDAVARHREEPDRLREILRVAVTEQPPPPHRWRLFHLFIEFGRTEDIPFLLEQLPTAQTPFERKVILGAARGLYQPGANVAELSLSVTEFAFVRTQPPAPLDGNAAGKWQLSASVFERYHQEELPAAVIAKINSLKGKRFETREKLAKTLRKRLTRRQWRRHGKALLAPVSPLPQQIGQEGVLRFALRNPSQQPLLVQVEFDAWYGRLEPFSEPQYLFVESFGEAGLDLPVRAVTVRGGPPLRVDVRMREINGAFVPLFQQLRIAQ